MMRYKKLEMKINVGECINIFFFFFELLYEIYNFWIYVEKLRYFWLKYFLKYLLVFLKG